MGLTVIIIDHCLHSAMPLKKAINEERLPCEPQKNYKLRVKNCAAQQ
jgi:hypothetical protein